MRYFGGEKMLKEIMEARNKAERDFWDAHRVAWERVQPKAKIMPGSKREPFSFANVPRGTR